MFAFHVDANNIFMDWGLIMSFSTAIKESVSTKVHIGYFSYFYYNKNFLNESFLAHFSLENGKELMKIDGGLLWAAIPMDISVPWLIQSTHGKIHGSGTDNTQVYPWQSLYWEHLLLKILPSFVGFHQISWGQLINWEQGSQTHSLNGSLNRQTAHRHVSILCRHYHVVAHVLDHRNLK